MARIIKRNKALSVSPLKSGQPVGASLAFLGINRAIPMMHGSQGCCAFGKIFFVRHFREPIALQTTAIDHLSAIMGADDNIIEGLKTICGKSKPDLIGLPTTGLSETQGADVKDAVKRFRGLYPEYDDIGIVPVNTPDFNGCMETGFAAALEAMITRLVPERATGDGRPGGRPRRVNVLAASFLTPGDVEWLKDTIALFGLCPVVVPDLAGSLDGHLSDPDYSPLPIGGAPVSGFANMGSAAASLVIGPSLSKAGDILRERTGVPDYRFDHLMGLEAVDGLLLALSAISGNEVPECLQRRRSQLQDAMLDTHFMLGQARFAIAADPDLLNAFCGFLVGMGAEVVAAVAAGNAPVLKRAPTEEVKIGDLEDLEHIAGERSVDIVIGNSHALGTAERLGAPLLRAGFPQYDLVGGYRRNWIGYRGARRTLFDLANMILDRGRHEIKPYHSIYAQKCREVSSDGFAAVFEGG